MSRATASCDAGWSSCTLGIVLEGKEQIQSIQTMSPPTSSFCWSQQLCTSPAPRFIFGNSRLIANVSYKDRCIQKRCTLKEMHNICHFKQCSALCCQLCKVVFMRWKLIEMNTMIAGSCIIITLRYTCGHKEA